MTEKEQAIPAVEFRNVSFSFDDEKVLDGISFTVMRGEIKIILSAKKCGRSL
jgi:ABC-type transporter Mla maintaining outer membrane lipid asymmetry ATPase subunit MlaF